MIYYGNNATPKRIEWWNSLPEREQNLRICLFEIQKIAIPEQKTLLRYKKSRKEVLNAKAILKQLFQSTLPHGSDPFCAVGI